MTEHKEENILKIADLFLKGVNSAPENIAAGTGKHTAEKAERFGSGHINDTFLVTAGGQRYILQRVNTEIFRDPDGLMENISRITDHIRQKAEAEGKDPERATLRIFPTAGGELFYRGEDGGAWRMMTYIPDTFSSERPENREMMRESGLAFGHFQGMLSDFPAETLHETIPAFHDTKARFAAFCESVRADVCGRADSVREEINQALRWEYLAERHPSRQDPKGLPLRVTHNDTKMSNVLFERTPDGIRAVCAVDLDTVMPGFVMDDFGDAVRSGCNTAAEDEPDPGKVHFLLPYYEAFRDGFLEGCGDRLTEEEIRTLPDGARIMTYENGIRFLKDYLDGDVYFRIHRPDQNLDRARCQFALLREM